MTNDDRPAKVRQLLKKLELANTALFRAQDDLDSAVRAAYKDVHITWADIGDTLGITRQAAWDRFHSTTDVPLPLQNKKKWNEWALTEIEGITRGQR